MGCGHQFSRRSTLTPSARSRRWQRSTTRVTRCCLTSPRISSSTAPAVTGYTSHHKRKDQRVERVFKYFTDKGGCLHDCVQRVVDTLYERVLDELGLWRDVAVKRAKQTLLDQAVAAAQRDRLNEYAVNKLNALTASFSSFEAFDDSLSASPSAISSPPPIVVDVASEESDRSSKRQRTSGLSRLDNLPIDSRDHQQRSPPVTVCSSAAYAPSARTVACAAHRAADATRATVPAWLKRSHQRQHHRSLQLSRRRQPLPPSAPCSYRRWTRAITWRVITSRASCSSSTCCQRWRGSISPRQMR